MHSLFGGKGGRVPPPTRKLVIRKANSQRDLRPITERITLEKVLGITASTNASLACNPVTGIIAYPAGCIVVLFNPRRNKQEFILNTSKKTITAVAFSRDGKYLATGESGHLPSVRVWNVEDPAHPQISEMAKGHKHGVSCVAFSPNLKYIVSVGYQHDMLINIWTWKDGSKAACNKVSTKVYAIYFSESANFFVTCGVRHVKFWYFDTESNKAKHDKTLPIMGRAALLGELRNNTFCDIVCGIGNNADYTYCVTNSGMLCSFSGKRILDKWVELREQPCDVIRSKMVTPVKFKGVSWLGNWSASKAQCITVSEQYIFCGCTDGIIRVFDPSSLQFITTLPKPHFLGVNVADGIDPSHLIAKTENVLYADTVALALDMNNYRLTCVYNDHSLYIWDLKDIKKIGKIWSSLYHSACVWGLEVYPEVTDNKHAALPPGTFLTCSGDDTVRVWNVAEGTNISFQRNIYSKELMRVLYMDDCYANLKDKEHSPTSKNVHDASSDSRNGLRTISASPDGQHLAIGDRSGNVRVYDMMFLDEILKIEAHESEVLCVEFSPPDSGYKLLASAGRDRLIHIFDTNKDYTLIQTLDDHSACITSVKFNVDDNGDFQLLSCGADKSIIFRSAQHNPDLQFVRNTNYFGKTTLYDMVIDSSRNLAATACQDRNVRVYDSVTGKQMKCYKGTQSDDGTLVKIAMDNSGFYAATSCSDKTLSFYDFETGECMANMAGHSEIVTGIRFTNDCKHLITVSGDGCIFLWAIPSTYTQNMVERLSDMGQELPKELQPETPLRRGTYKVRNPVNSESNGFGSPATTAITRESYVASPPVADYRFSVGQLPSWAKKQIIAESGLSSVSPEHDVGGPVQPGGRWAQRVIDGDLHVVSEVSPLRPISPSLDGNASERKKFSTGSESFQEQVETLANSPLERKCSLTMGEDDDLFPANARAHLDALTEKDLMAGQPNGDVPMGVSMSRGSDLFTRTRTLTGEKLMLIQTEEIKFEEAEEFKEDDVKESIIYLPPCQDDMDTETASINRFSGVKEITRHYEALNSASGRQLWRKLQLGRYDVENMGNIRPQATHIHDWNVDKLDYVPVKIEKIVRSFQVTASQRPQKRSVEDGQDLEDDSKHKLVDHKRKQPDDSSSEDEDGEDPLNSLSDVNKTGGAGDESRTKLESPDEEGDDEMCRKYFDYLGSTPTETKPEVEVAPEVPPPPENHGSPLTARLSISARFLSRSQQTSLRNAVSHGLDSLAEEKAEKAREASLEEHKQEIKKRKEEMARAVDATRKRLEALGWKAKEDILKKTPPSPRNSQTLPPVASSLQITLTPTSQRPGSLDSNSTKLSDVVPVLDRESRRNNLESEPTAISQERVGKLAPTDPSQPVTLDPPLKTASLASSFPVSSEHTQQGTHGTDLKVTSIVPSTVGGDTPAIGHVSSTSLTSDTTVVTNLRQTRLAVQLVPEKDDSVWVLRDEVKKKPKESRSATDLLALFTHTKTPPGKGKSKEDEQSTGKEDEEGKGKDSAKEKDKKKQKEKKEKDKPKREPFVVGKLEKRDSASSLTSHTKSSWRRSLGFGGFSSKSKDKKEDRRGSTPFVSITKAADTATQGKKTDKVQLRDRKGRMTSEERRVKSRSLGDIDQRLKPLKEVSILDSTEPPSRVVSTADIPREIENKEHAGSVDSPIRSPGSDKSSELCPGHIALTAERDLFEPPYIERKSLALSRGSSPSADKSGAEAHSEIEKPAVPSKSELQARLPVNKTESESVYLPMDKSGVQDGNTTKPVIKQALYELKASSKSPLLSGRELKSKTMPNVSDLSAELSAALASPPPQPIRLPVMDSSPQVSPPPSTARKSPVGIDRDPTGTLDRQTCEEAVNQLVRAFQSVTDLHSKALEEEHSDGNEDMLTLLSATFSAMEEQIYHCRNRRKYSSVGPRHAASHFNPRPLSSNFSFSTGNLDTIRHGEPASTARMTRGASEACVLTAVEEHEAANLESVLEKYSDKLVELVKQKLTK